MFTGVLTGVLTPAAVEERKMQLYWVNTKGCCKATIVLIRMSPNLSIDRQQADGLEEEAR